MKNLGIIIEVVVVARDQDVLFLKCPKACSIAILQRASFVLRACSKIDKSHFRLFCGKITAAKCSF